MHFWQQHESELEYLSRMALDYLVTTPTSVPSENAFSTASYILRKQRSVLTPDNLSYSMLLKDKFDDDDEIDN